MKEDTPGGALWDEQISHAMAWHQHPTTGYESPPPEELGSLVVQRGGLQPTGDIFRNMVCLPSGEVDEMNPKGLPRYLHVAP